MRKFSDKYLNSTVICPMCKQKRKGREMMSCIRMCKHCYEKQRSDTE